MNVTIVRSRGVEKALNSTLNPVAVFPVIRNVLETITGADGDITVDNDCGTLGRISTPPDDKAVSVTVIVPATVPC